MSEDHLLSDLKAFGLDDLEAQTYLMLARLGKARASSLSVALKANRTTTYRVLERLKQTGVVESSLSRPVSYIAVEPRKALQLLIDRQKEVLKVAENKFPSIIERFTRLYIPQQEVISTKFSIFQGSEEIQRAITRMTRSADKNISMITTVRDLGKMYYSGAYEELTSAKSRGVQVQIVTEVTDVPSLEVVKNYDFAETRHQAGSMMKMVVKDEEEVLITVSSVAEEEVALWTYSQSFASAMQAIINKDFFSGTELAAMSTALATGKPAESVRIIAGEQEYADNLLSLLSSAKSDVFIGFKFFPTFTSHAVLEVLRTLAERGVKVRVLSAPSADEIDIVRRLYSIIDFRISAFQTELQIMIVDGKEMLFSNAPMRGKSSALNILTNLTGMVTFMHKIMADVWLDSREYMLRLDELQQSITLNTCASMVRTKMQEFGMEIEVGTKILGKSGVLHDFDIISRSTKTGNRVAISFLAHSDLKATGTKLMESKIKLLDCEPIELLIGLLTKEDSDLSTEKLTKAVGLPVFQAKDAEELAQLVLREVEKR